MSKKTLSDEGTDLIVEGVGHLVKNHMSVYLQENGRNKGKEHYFNDLKKFLKKSRIQEGCETFDYCMFYAKDLCQILDCEDVTPDMVPRLDNYKLCGYCGKHCKSRCARCKAVWYCNTDCQRKAYPSHKELCRLGQNGYTTGQTAEYIYKYQQLSNKMSNSCPPDANPNCEPKK